MNIKYLLLLNYVRGYSLPKLPTKNKIINISLQSSLNYAIVPISTIVDSYWINRIGSVNEISGTLYANNIFKFIYNIFSVISIVITNIIKNENEYKQYITLTFVIINIPSIIIAFLLFNKYPRYIINNTEIIYDCCQYLKVRSIGLFFAVNNSLMYGILRGFTDFKIIIRINLISQILNIVLDYLLLDYGIKGIAIATSISELYAFLSYIIILQKKDIFKRIKDVKKKIINIITKTSFLQIKNICSNLILLHNNNKLINLNNFHYINTNILFDNYINLCTIIYQGLYNASIILLPDEHIRNKILKYTFIISIFNSIIFLLYCLKINLNNNVLYIFFIYQILYGICYVNDGIFIGYSRIRKSVLSNIIQLLITLILSQHMNSYLNLWLIQMFTVFIKIIIYNN